MHPSAVKASLLAEETEDLTQQAIHNKALTGLLSHESGWVEESSSEKSSPELLASVSTEVEQSGTQQVQARQSVEMPEAQGLGIMTVPVPYSAGQFIPPLQPQQQSAYRPLYQPWQPGFQPLKQRRQLSPRQPPREETMDEVLEGLERFEQQRANLRKYVGMPEEQGKGKAKANGALQSIQFLIPPPQPLPRASWVATPLSYPKQQQQSLQPPQPHLDQPLPPNSVQPPQPDPMQDVQSPPHVRVQQPTESPEPSQAALHTRHTQRLRAPGQNQSSQHGQSLEVPEPALMSRRSQRLQTSRQNQSSQRDQSPEAPESAPATEPSQPVLFSEQIQPD
ncbi:hypothetical protein LTR09_007666 [Extremus antarcticus]|uniref:Uncharacterized protein n=1 Tax=Extremus antarcticus TaxID=702011 RepID=A0AAJ0DJA4_9PEZI|nr:hypothetical protein LTR09_007666 [Extremus antarcticus]